MFRLTPACAAALLLGACSPAADNNAAPSANAAAPSANAAAPTAAAPAPAAVPAPGPDDVSIVVRGNGLLVETPGHAVPLNFETTTPAEAAAALAALGAPKRSSNKECPPGPLDFMDWSNGLQLAFQDGKLAGWWADDKSIRIATAAGLAPGSPRSALGATKIEDSTVGKVFTVDEVNGFLDEGKGVKVTELWAGVACIFS